MDTVASHTELTATRTRTHARLPLTHTRVVSARHGAQPLGSTRPGVLVTGHTEQRQGSAETTTRKWATSGSPAGVGAERRKPACSSSVQTCVGHVYEWPLKQPALLILATENTGE